jgi:signal transduction histidine kinase
LIAEIVISLLIGLLVGGGASAVLFRRQTLAIRHAERRARAAERLAEIGAMTGGLAHEIKNPLSTIGLNAQLLGEAVNESPLTDADKQRMVNRVMALRRETERLGGILNDFLEYAGKIRLDIREHDLNALVSELADFYTPEAARHGVRLRVDLAPGELKVKLDAQRVKQCVLNLMLNAVQAMQTASTSAAEGPNSAASGSRGELILKTAARREQSRPMADVHVIDTGPGIPPEVKGKLFEPYFTTKAGGSGLGLPTARRLIEAHTGRVEVFSERGKGSDFLIVLPVDGPPILPEG